MINPFEKRIPPGYWFVLPKPSVMPLLGLVLVFIGFVIADSVQAYVVLVCGIGLIVHRLYIIFTQYSYWLVRESMSKGKKLFTLPTFGASDKEIFADAYGWKTAETAELANDQQADFIIHHDGAISIVFVWDGVHNRYFNHEEFDSEHKNRLALLNRLSTEYGFVVENHMLRRKDTRLVDAYEREGRKMFKGQKPPKIIGEIRQGIADIARQYGRSNKVMTVLSVDANSQAFNWLSLFKPSMAKRNQQFDERALWLFKELNRLSSYFPGLKLLDRDGYAKLVQAVRNPYLEQYQAVDWRLPLNEQLVYKKPSWNEELECLELDGVVYKVCLLQGYPALSYPWVFKFAEATIDLHVVQIIKPKKTQKALDKNKNEQEMESNAANKRKSMDILSARISDFIGFRQYVAKNGLTISDNAYVVTFTCKAADKYILDRQFKTFMDIIERKEAGLEGGVLRTDKDLQMDYFRVRLPGLGRNSLFLREDHSDTVAAMMPYTTFPVGSKNPESLRVDITGNLVGFSPSKCSVAHEMTVGKTDGGKDTMYGMKMAETYPVIRYDVVEMGNSYQGFVEAIGGRYCTARDQIINPLSSYREFYDSIDQVKRFKPNANITAIEDHTLASQMMILTPVFKGMNGESFSRAEQVIMLRALKHLYHNPVPGAEAPVLPMFLTIFNSMELTESRHVQARDQLAESLYDFLEGVGSSFKQQGQFVISDVANAIDFDKFDGELADFFMSFMCVRLAANAFSRGARNQIVLNEYKVLLEKSPEVIRWITLSIDRMGRKDWVGLTRISQGFEEIKSVDSEVISSIENVTLLARKDNWQPISEALNMPGASVNFWKNFKLPKANEAMDYREAFVREGNEWYHLFLKYPEIGLKLMNTNATDKELRNLAYSKSQDAYERIRIFDELKAQQIAKEKAENEAYENMAIV